MAIVVAFGNPVYDDVCTPDGSTQHGVLSGCSTNSCLALAQLGHHTALVGAISGDDRKHFVATMARGCVEVYPQQSAQTCRFRLSYKHCGALNLHVLTCADTLAMVPPICARADAVLVGPILQEITLDLVVQIVAATSAPLFLDLQGLVRRTTHSGCMEHYLPEHLCAVTEHCTLIKANEVETMVLTGVDPRSDPSAAAHQLRSYGSAIAVITLAERGSVIDDGERQYYIPAFRTSTQNPTGAGDAYLAGFLHAYLHDPADLCAAGCFGAALASIWIEHDGPDTPVSHTEVTRRAAFLQTQSLI